uniref:Uncharacterized protein n=1 Tax=Anas zonorhyncha TaxID=75864 RepID=A0A8B9W450_9AVES
MSAPALGLPDVIKPFFLFSLEKQGIALGILAQDLGPYPRAVAYFSKQLDAAAKGLLGCLRAIAAVVLNIQEAHKFTLGQKITSSPPIYYALHNYLIGKNIARNLYATITQIT